MKREQYKVVDGGDSQQPREYGFTDVGASDRGYWLVVLIKPVLHYYELALFFNFILTFV